MAEMANKREPEGWGASRDEALRLIDAGEYEAAVAVLDKAAAGDTSGDCDAWLGLAHFRNENYDASVRHYESALKQQPDNEDWRQMYAAAWDNAAAEAQVFVPELRYFDESELVAPPPTPPLPTGPEPAPPVGVLTSLRRALGNIVGFVGTIVFDVGTQIWGRLRGYRDEVWTNWYRRGLYRGIFTLAYMREQLNKHNLRNTYPKGALIGFQEKGQAPPPGVKYFRTADGTWNNLDNPKEGAAGTRFPRNVENEAIRVETQDELMTPNPRAISRKLLARGEKMKEIPFLNMLAAVWIQFQNHDWITHGDNLLPQTLDVPLDEDDPVRRKYRMTKMFIPRTQPDPTRRAEDETPTTFINEVTHWWDASQIYGSDQQTQDRLRSGIDGKMRLHDDGTLPLDKKRVEDSGMMRNWWVGLSMLHLLFVKEHNAICDHLKTSYPDWDDNRLFNVARLINAAVTAKIHTVEWTPAVLPNPGLDKALNANWYGILTTWRKPENQKTVADINVRNPELGGVVGNPIKKHGTPYGLTEEFVEVYRLHSFLPEELEIRRMDGDGEPDRLPFASTRQAGSRKVTERYSMPDLFHSFGIQQPGALELNNYPHFLRELSVPGFPVLDMATVDILRARERGVPRYNEFRRQLGLNPIKSFDDLTDDKEAVAKIKEVYGDRPEDVEKLDLLVGTLSEGHRPTNFGFGETMFQIFILNATRRLQADRFYTDDYNEQTYTAEGLEWIDKADFKSVLLRNFPELKDTGLANVKNAFEPWDTEERLDKERHPLREYSKELKPDPWRGDAYR